jgi:carbon-monoxide dehydrogenase large subunit
VERYHAVDDFGRILRPDLVERRLRGGIVRGLGRALREELLTEMSERSSSSPPPSYPLPRITDVPVIAMVRLESRVDWNPLGAGGVGESGVAGALSAITNAVMDALRGCGVESIDVPLLPEKLWRAVRRTGPPAGAAPLEQEITRDPGSV